METNYIQNEIDVPEPMDDGGTIIRIDEVGKIYILNRRGVYSADINEDEFTKISECDFIYYTDRDLLSFDDALFVDENEFYYETTTWEEEEEATNTFVQCILK